MSKSASACSASCSLEANSLVRTGSRMTLSVFASGSSATIPKPRGAWRGPFTADASASRSFPIGKTRHVSYDAALNAEIVFSVFSMQLEAERHNCTVGKCP